MLVVGKKSYKELPNGTCRTFNLGARLIPLALERGRFSTRVQMHAPQKMHSLESLGGTATWEKTLITSTPSEASFPLLPSPRGTYTSILF